MKKSVKFIISAIISIILVYFLFTKINIKELYKVLTQVNPILLFESFLLYLILIVFRTIRFRILLKNSISFLELIPIICKHAFLKVLVPFKIGELSFVYLLKKKKHCVGKSLSSLIVARIFDFSIFIGVFILIIILSNKFIGIKFFSELIPYAIIMFFGLIICLILVIFSPELIIKLLKKLNFNKLINLISPFKELKSKHLLTKTFIVSLIIYFISIFATYLLLLSTGFSLPLNIFIITITLSTLSGFLPINGVAGLGTVEAVIALTLSYFGYSTADSIILGFSIHILQIFFVILVGIIGWTFPNTKRKKT